MKIWYGYSSEHSANLVMIGRFKEITDAEEVKSIIDALTEQVSKDEKTGFMTIGEPADKYSDEMENLLKKFDIYSIGPYELQQLAYDVHIEIKNKEIILTTEEGDVSAFIKVFIDKGARVEIYSAHNYPDTGYGRGG